MALPGDLEERLRDFFTLFRPHGSLSILAALSPDACGASPRLLRHELNARLPSVPARVISTSLDSLEDAGLVSRTLRGERPLYSLTDKGVLISRLLPLVIPEELQLLLAEAVALRGANRATRHSQRASSE